ncbi:hypothetical protein SKA34_10710 [Photobacterium sp. SKA34]|nr:hypothetical protein SKA34_10710 [Photobacterium sp. SKA34]
MFVGTARKTGEQKWMASHVGLVFGLNYNYKHLQKFTHVLTQNRVRQRLHLSMYKLLL